MHERLIGAIVLIVIAAIMVPWLMSHAHHPREHLHDLAMAAAPAASVPPALALPPATAGAGEEAGQASRVAGVPPSTPHPASSALAQIAAPKKTPKQQPVVQAAAPPGSPLVAAKKAAPKPPIHTRNSARQGAPPQTSAPAQATPASAPPLGQGILHKGDWYVQVASFASHANAAQMAILLTRAGYQAFLATNESGGTLYYRVRVGPYPSAARARAVAPGLAAISGSPVVVRQANGNDG